jgi:hypothetical protein
MEKQRRMPLDVPCPECGAATFRLWNAAAVVDLDQPTAWSPGTAHCANGHDLLAPDVPEGPSPQP